MERVVVCIVGSLVPATRSRPYLAADAATAVVAAMLSLSPHFSDTTQPDRLSCVARRRSTYLVKLVKREK